MGKKIKVDIVVPTGHSCDHHSGCVYNTHFVFGSMEVGDGIFPYFVATVFQKEEETHGCEEPHFSGPDWEIGNIRKVDVSGSYQLVKIGSEIEIDEDSPEYREIIEAVKNRQTKTPPQG